MQGVLFKYKEWFQLEKILLCELSSVLLSSLLIAEIFMENFAVELNTGFHCLRVVMAKKGRPGGA